MDIFISSKMQELKPEREALYKLLPTLSSGSVSLRAWVYEDEAEASNKSIRDVYLKALENSALYIGLFWKQYGDWTIDEFKRATEWGIDRHIYVKKLADGEQRDEKLQQFLDSISGVESGLASVWFDDADDLRKAIERSVKIWLEERMVRRPGATSATFARDADDLLERPRKLIGRDDLLAQTNALLDSGEPVLLQGFGGMGKTALAAEVTAQCIAEGKGSALWLRAGDETHEALFEAMARPFNMQQEIAKETGDAQIQAVRQLLKSRGVKLLVLDDVWNAKALAQVMKAVPRDVSLLVTARQRYPGLRLIDVGKLARPASLELLSYHAGTNYAADSDDDKLCAKLGDSAYALRVAGMTMAVDRLKPNEMLQRIESAPHKLKMPLGFADEGQESVAALLEASLNALYLSGTEGKRANAVFLAFGALFAPSATPELLSLYMGDSVGAQGLAPLQNNPILETALAELQRRGLADRIEQTEDSVAYCRVHDLAFSYARAQVLDEQRHRALDACLAYTEHYNEPKVEYFAALRPELDNFMGAAGWGMRTGHYAEVEQFAWDLYQGSEILDWQGFYIYATGLLKQAAIAAEKQGNLQNQGVHLSNLGSTYHNLGQYEQAIEHYRQALDIARQINDQRAESSLLGNLGTAFRYMGQYEQAIEHYQQALDIARQINDQRVESNLLGNLGDAYADLGQYEQAIEHYQQALGIARQINDQRVESNLLGNLGDAYKNLGQYTRAIAQYKQALSLSYQIRDRRSESSLLGKLGKAYAYLRQYTWAIENYQQALDITRKIGDRRGESNLLGNLGDAYAYLQQYTRAIEHFQQALDIAREISDQRNEANWLGNLGNAYDLLGQYTQAIEHFQQALNIARQIGDRRGEGYHLGNLGIAYADRGQYTQAIEHYQQALAIKREVGDKNGEANDLNNIGSLYNNQGNYDRAIQHYQQSRSIYAAIGVKHLVELVDRNISHAHAAQSKSVRSWRWPWQRQEITRSQPPSGENVPPPKLPQQSPPQPPSGSVQFSAYYPKEVNIGVWQPLYAYIFRETAADDVITDSRQELGLLYSAFNQLTQLTRRVIPRGARITATPYLDGFQFNPLNLTISFDEDWHRFDFRLRAKNAPLNMFSTGYLIFTTEGVIVADIPISVYVGESRAESGITSIIQKPYPAIFASYSHDDAQIVERVERAYMALGLDYLRDVVTLKSGQKWHDGLFNLIEQADIFQLFWSTTAAKSSYVEKEWKHACDLVKQGRKHDNFIRPVYWVKPMPEPPSELALIQFAYQPDLGN
jgi:tetratricopeptide (TPR) repeat protein